jgi:hypothetical protein
MVNHYVKKLLKWIAYICLGVFTISITLFIALLLIIKAAMVYHDATNTDYSIGIDTMRTYGQTLRYQLTKSPTRRADFYDCKNKAVLEADFYYCATYNSKVFVQGYTGYTIVDLQDNSIKHFRRNSGAGAAGEAIEINKLKSLYEKCEIIKGFEEFSEDEKKQFKLMQSNIEKIGIGKEPYKEKYVGNNMLRLVYLFPKELFRLVERYPHLSKPSVIDIRLINVNTTEVVERNVLFMLEKAVKSIFTAETILQFTTHAINTYLNSNVPA